MTWLIYGAYGYTGELIAREAVDRGLDPILAGRSRESVDALAAELDCEARAFALSGPALAQQLDDVDLVLNCAGPFVDTHEPLVAACLDSDTHYLDITGEIEVFESIRGFDDRARRAGLTLLPGVGFDVVPSDCLAAHLAERLPGAESLSIGYQPAGGFSRGTLKTAIAGLGEPGLVRRDGRLEAVPVGHETREIDFGEGSVPATTVPLGDVSTAYHTTGIPDVDCYLAVPPVAARLLRYQRYLAPLLALDPVQGLLESVVDRLVDGPDAETRAETTATLWGEVSDGDATRVSRLRTPNVYRTTTLAALEAVERTLAGDAPDGYQTPASAFGSDLILSIEGVERIDEWHR
ncbi:saccharopine dehydrogenase family protein [Halapricum desulfuricans]|uniref:Saccharopine dehydrogenase n=1 Tax=Halapricum desulfuricans TaxID=2841257 RepID=A0A897NBV8_9EURY|nr:saccharopine dehydrogenase NADP-binding domain-containing protein [Halapricum desulfuricans]QSG10122.1 Saccharopine dehydrogenase [Halapricum desulfuricans]